MITIKHPKCENKKCNNNANIFKECPRLCDNCELKKDLRDIEKKINKI